MELANHGEGLVQIVYRHGGQNTPLCQETVSPIGARAACSALRANAADACEDRVSENIFDLEDEYAEADIIVHGMSPGANRVLRFACAALVR
jgi:hypothetical protein